MKTDKMIYKKTFPYDSTSLHVPVKIYNKDESKCYELDALIDTGAEETVINSEIVRILELDLQPTNIEISGVNSTDKADSSIFKMEFARDFYFNGNMLAMDMSESMIIGMGTLKQFNSWSISRKNNNDIELFFEIRLSEPIEL